MKVLIVEDETSAYESLVDILKEIDPAIKIAGNTESVSQTIHWFKENPSPDLILMDIHLSDGSAFLIFEYMEIEVPVIFTTAYDEYAIEAFKVNSIDYLLKPVKARDLQRALTKFNKWSPADIMACLSKLSQQTVAKRYKNRLLIPVKDTLLPVEVNQISYFYSSDKTTFLCLTDGTQLPYFGSLDLIFSTLDPESFYRANKQYIVARNKVKNITVWFDSRLLLNMDAAVPEPIYISKNKAADFKSWIING